MALDELIGRLEHESRAEAERVRKEAEKDAERILSEARAKAGEILRAAKEEAKAGASARRKEAEAIAELKAGAVVRKAKSEAAEREARKVEALVMRGLKARREDVIRNAVRRFAESVPVKEMAVTADRSDEKLVRRLGLANARYSKGAEFSLASRDGAISMHVSLDRIIEQYRDVMNGMVSKELFGKEG